ncbi:hypothetical protein BN1723_019809, partial [Verticillium longisporum]
RPASRPLDPLDRRPPRQHCGRPPSHLRQRLHFRPQGSLRAPASRRPPHLLRL